MGLPTNNPYNIVSSIILRESFILLHQSYGEECNDSFCIYFCVTLSRVNILIPEDTGLIISVIYLYATMPYLYMIFRLILYSLLQVILSQQKISHISHLLTAQELTGLN